MRSFCLKGELCDASLALNARSCSFELKRGATFANVCHQQVCSELLRLLDPAQLGNRRDYVLLLGVFIGKTFGLIKSTACITSEEVSHCAIIMRLGERTCWSEKLLARM